MATTILFKFVFYSSASPAVVLTSTELTGGAEPTVNISTVALADGTTIASVVSGGALTYDSYTKSWSYRLASADLATYCYTAMATTTYATASPASVHALGIVIPDALVSAAPGDALVAVNLDHLVKVAKDTDWATTVTKESLLDLMTSKDTSQTFARATDSLEGQADAGLSTQAKLDVNAEVDTALNTAIPGSPTTDSINERVAAIDTAAAAILIDTNELQTDWANGGRLDLLLDGLGAGTGTGTYTDTITDGTNPLDGVRVQLSTDAIGAHRVYEAFTDALGVFTMSPDPGTYYVWFDLAGMSFTQGAQVTVT
jgi:hypothetical protein